MLLKSGSDYGWPECYYDGLQKKLVLAPEYGGNGSGAEYLSRIGVRIGAKSHGSSSRSSRE
jgi:hypothetical protein